MLLPVEEAALFFRLYLALLCYVNRHRSVVPAFDDPRDFGNMSMDERLEVRKSFLGEQNLLDQFAEENPFGFSAADLDIIRSWRNLVSGRFIVFRQLKKHTLFLSAQTPVIAYGVTGLTEPPASMMRLPFLAETVLLPFEGKIIWDGLFAAWTLNAEVRESLDDMYSFAKDQSGIVTSLPAAKSSRARSRVKREIPTSAPAKDAPSAIETILGLIDRFCLARLDGEYADVCRLLVEKLARRRPSPLLSGKPEVWAAAIVRTIGWVNFLDDPSRQPFMKLAEIERTFGVAVSSGQAKSNQIRTMLRIRPFAPEWTVMSLLDESPVVWMLEVNGLLMDIRQMPREVQQAAFEKGLIPWIPADRAK